MQEEKKKDILEATLRVIDQKKISGLRMHLIAKEAGVTQSILHYYFESKEALLNALLEYIEEKFVLQRKEIMGSTDKSFEEQLDIYFGQKKELIEKEKAIDGAQIDYWVQGTVDENIRPVIQSFYSLWREEIISSLEKEKELSKEEKKEMSFIMVSIMMGATLQYLIDEKSFSLDNYFQLSKDMILCYLEMKK